MKLKVGTVFSKEGSRRLRGNLIIEVHMGQEVMEHLCDPSNGGGFIHELQVHPFKVTPQPWGVWDGESQLRLGFEGERSARDSDLSEKVEEVLTVVRRWEEYYVEDYPEWEFRVE